MRIRGIYVDDINVKASGLLPSFTHNRKWNAFVLSVCVMSLCSSFYKEQQNTLKQNDTSHTLDHSRIIHVTFRFAVWSLPLRILLSLQGQFIG